MEAEFSHDLMTAKFKHKIDQTQGLESQEH